jgi:hypothetical protein
MKITVEVLYAEAISYDITKIKLGGQGGIRTHGTIAGTRAFQARPFGHSGTCPNIPAISAGFEPATFGSASQRSIQLSYEISRCILRQFI